MFVDFKKVFNQNTQPELNIPQHLIEYLSESLPKGVKYKVDENGNCVIIGEDGSCELGGFVLELNDKQKEILGEDCTFEDIMNYSYNSQQPILLSLAKEGKVILNGEEFPVDRMAYNPYFCIKNTFDKFSMYPEKMAETMPIKLGCDELEREVIINRIPNESVSNFAFESNEEEPLKINGVIDFENRRIKLNISFSLKNAKTIRDVVESISIYNAFIEGRGLLLGEIIGAGDTGAEKFDKEALAFWKKVLKIESYLGVSFKPTGEDIYIETACLVEKLYQNLINKTPIRDNQIINSISGKWHDDKINKEIESTIGKPLYYEYEMLTTLNLFGVEIKLPALLGLFNTVLTEIIKDGDQQKLILADESPEKKRYTSIMLFKTEEELKSYTEIDANKRIKAFQDAKSPQDYI